MKKAWNQLVKDESAQGMTEYILLVVAVVAVVMAFRDQIQGALTDLMGRLQGDIANF